MKIIQVLKETVVANQVKLLDLCNNKAGDTVVGDVYLDVQDTNTVVAHGSVDGAEWHQLKLVDMANYAVVATVDNTTGYFMVPASGLAKLKFTFTGAGDVVIKETY